MARKKNPELTFQQHIAAYLVREHRYGVLAQAEITDTEHCIAEDQLWYFLKASQAETLKKLVDDYGTDARQEIFKALRKELAHTPLWMLFRHGLPVRGVKFQLYYAKPRSAESAGVKGYAENRLTFRPHFYFGDTNQEIDFVFYLNGLPIVALELKHEANQNVHDAVSQFTKRDHAHKIFQHPFLYLAADTSDAMAATDPSRAENFRRSPTRISAARYRRIATTASISKARIAARSTEASRRPTTRADATTNSPTRNTPILAASSILWP